MATTAAELADILRPYLPSEPSDELARQLLLYLDLLQRWNARTNLTALRSPREIIETHFGESLFAAQHLPPGLATLLDFGSGAGFPGLPIQLCHPALRVTLAESQGKKAAFLREVARTLGLPTEIHQGRVEDLPPERLFSAVTLRAVDNMAAAIPAAVAHLEPGGWLILLTTKAQSTQMDWPKALVKRPLLALPRSNQKVLLLLESIGY